jgi:hypothetical protein
MSLIVNPNRTLLGSDDADSAMQEHNGPSFFSKLNRVGPSLKIQKNNRESDVKEDQIRDENPELPNSLETRDASNSSLAHLAKQ